MLQKSRCACCGTEILVWHPDHWSSSSADLAVCSQECLEEMTDSFLLRGWNQPEKATYVHEGNLYVHFTHAGNKRLLRIDEQDLLAATA